MIINSYRKDLLGITSLMFLLLFSGCSQTNHPPTLEVIFENNNPLPGSKQTLTAVVTDQDSADIILINWEISKGTPYAATGSVIRYTAPEFNTTDTIRVEANDQNGGIVSETVLMNVSNGTPQIHSLNISQSAVLLGNGVTISVTASDPESLPLSYQFSSSGNVGSFESHEPEDSTIIWIAPSDFELAGEYQLFVTVSDSLGQSVSDTVSVIVYLENGTIWVVDSGLKTVKKYDENGQFILQSEENFDYPNAVTNNYPWDFECWVADKGLGKIFEINEDGTTIETYDNIWGVIDIEYHENTGTICALSQANQSLTLIMGTEIKTIYGFQSPNSMVINQNADEVLISDYGRQQIIKIDLLPSDGVFPDSISTDNYLDALNGVLNGPKALAITKYSSLNGIMLLVADKINNRIERVPFTSSYDDPLPPITDVIQPIGITTTLNYSWVLEEDGTIRFFDTFDGSSSQIITIEELTNSQPMLITGDYPKDAIWIGDNTTNKIIKAIYNNGIVEMATMITGVNSVENIVVNR